MAWCTKCGDEYSDERKKIGYDTCLRCGEEAAQKANNRLRQCTAPAFNKGPYQPVTSTEQAKLIGRK